MMDKQSDVKSIAFEYSAYIIKKLLTMELISQDEYDRIMTICKNHYHNKICV